MLYMASYWWTGTRHIALESRYLKAMLVNGCLLMLNYQVTSTCSRISPPPSLVFLKTNLISPTKHIVSCVPAVKNKGGRPKGTTNATKEDYDHSFNEALKCAAEAYIALRDEADKKVGDGQIPTMLKEIESKYNLRSGSLNYETVGMRARRQKHLPSYCCLQISISEQNDSWDSSCTFRAWGFDSHASSPM